MKNIQSVLLAVGVFFGVLLPLHGMQADTNPTGAPAQSDIRETDPNSHSDETIGINNKGKPTIVKDNRSTHGDNALRVAEAKLKAEARKIQAAEVQQDRLKSVQGDICSTQGSELECANVTKEYFDNQDRLKKQKAKQEENKKKLAKKKATKGKVYSLNGKYICTKKAGANPLKGEVDCDQKKLDQAKASGASKGGQTAAQRAKDLEKQMKGLSNFYQKQTQPLTPAARTAQNARVAKALAVRDALKITNNVRGGLQARLNAASALAAAEGQKCLTCADLQARVKNANEVLSQLKSGKYSQALNDYITRRTTQYDAAGNQTSLLSDLKKWNNANARLSSQFFGATDPITGRQRSIAERVALAVPGTVIAVGTFLPNVIKNIIENTPVGTDLQPSIEGLVNATGPKDGARNYSAPFVARRSEAVLNIISGGMASNVIRAPSRGVLQGLVRSGTSASRVTTRGVPRVVSTPANNARTGTFASAPRGVFGGGSPTRIAQTPPKPSGAASSVGRVPNTGTIRPTPRPAAPVVSRPVVGPRASSGAKASEPVPTARPIGGGGRGASPTATRSGSNTPGAPVQLRGATLAPETGVGLGPRVGASKSSLLTTRLNGASTRAGGAKPKATTIIDDIPGARQLGPGEYVLGKAAPNLNTISRSTGSRPVVALAPRGVSAFERPLWTPPAGAGFGTWIKAVSKEFDLPRVVPPRIPTSRAPATFTRAVPSTPAPFAQQSIPRSNSVFGAPPRATSNGLAPGVTDSGVDTAERVARINLQNAQVAEKQAQRTQKLSLIRSLLKQTKGVTKRTQELLSGITSTARTGGLPGQSGVRTAVQDGRAAGTRALQGTRERVRKNKNTVKTAFAGASYLAAKLETCNGDSSCEGKVARRTYAKAVQAATEDSSQQGNAPTLRTQRARAAQVQTGEYLRSQGVITDKQIKAIDVYVNKQQARALAKAAAYANTANARSLGSEQQGYSDLATLGKAERASIKALSKSRGRQGAGAQQGAIDKTNQKGPLTNAGNNGSPPPGGQAAGLGSTASGASSGASSGGSGGAGDIGSLAQGAAGLAKSLIDRKKAKKKPKPKTTRKNKSNAQVLTQSTSSPATTVHEKSVTKKEPLSRVKCVSDRVNKAAVLWDCRQVPGAVGSYGSSSEYGNFSTAGKLFGAVFVVPSKLGTFIVRCTDKRGKEIARNSCAVKRSVYEI